VLALIQSGGPVAAIVLGVPAAIALIAAGIGIGSRRRR
jgi:hypothetical protein